MADPSNSARYLWGLIAAGVVIGVAVVVWLNLPADDLPPNGVPVPGTTAAKSVDDVLTSTPRDFSAPKRSETHFLNAGPDAPYVGSFACVECHAAYHESARLAHPSRGVSHVDPRNEPPDGGFVHKPSGRAYRVYRKDGQIRHEEVVRAESGQVMARIDLPVRDVVGAGGVYRSYLVEVDGFMYESPITWYAAKKKWDMSPGYDFAQHWGFERRINVGCLACHSGRVEAKDDTVHRLAIREPTIGCESCHGPGSKHVEVRHDRKTAAGAADLTIVNPAKLPRARIESVCSTCHLGGQAAVAVRGRKADDFRPGMALADCRVDYKFDAGTEQMTVVGQVDQLRRSSCYQKSQMTCLTCHDTHARERPTAAAYRQKCLDCHASKGCSVPQSERLKKDAADNCVTCHLPRTDVAVPHLVFTNHRIAKPGSKPTASESVPELVPVEDVSHLSEIDRRRNLGLAYLEVAEKPELSRYAALFRERARQHLEAVYKAGLRDGATTEGLAELYHSLGDPRAGLLAREALTAKDLAPNQRALAGAVIANALIRVGDYKGAAQFLLQVTRLRRQSDDYLLLGQCLLQLNQPDLALEALNQAEAIRPYRPDVHKSLADAYQLKGDKATAQQHLDKANWLNEHHQQ
jgi:hypothetical protein